MDATRFDRWTRLLALARPRRGAMRLLIAGALAGTVGSEVIAKNKGKGNGKKKGCSKKEKKCGKKCIPKSACCDKNDCDRCALEVCKNGVCDCADEAERSFGVCGVAPNCLSAGLVTQDPTHCCSVATVYDPQSGQTRCLPGKRECIVPYDCESGGLDSCRGFMCPELYYTRVPLPCV